MSPNRSHSRKSKRSLRFLRIILNRLMLPSLFEISKPYRKLLVMGVPLSSPRLSSWMTTVYFSNEGTVLHLYVCAFSMKFYWVLWVAQSIYLRVDLPRTCQILWRGIFKTMKLSESSYIFAQFTTISKNEQLWSISPYWSQFSSSN